MESSTKDELSSGLSYFIGGISRFLLKLASEEEHSDFEGQEFLEFHPNIWNFFYSHHLCLAVFVNILNNRINAIVAPRNPRSLSLSTRLLLRLLCFFWMIKSAMVLIARIAGDVPWMQKYVSPSMVQSYSIDYTDHQALWLCLKSLAGVYIMKAFHSSLENRSLPGREQATNLYEWALLFHLYASPYHSNIDLLIIALLELLDTLFLEILYLHPRGTQYRLIPTSIIGFLGIIHFAYALRFSDRYPLLQSVARFPELALICVIVMCTVLHGIAIMATGGDLRGRFFLDARSLPSLNQDYTMALYSIGMACVEASRTDGYRNELNPISVPMGTVFETTRRRRKSNRRRPTCGFDNEQLDDSGIAASQEPDDNPLRLAVMANFAISLVHAVADWGSWILDRLPLPFLPRRNNAQQTMTNGVVSSSVGNDGHISELEELDTDEELYARFLRNEDLSDSDDDDDNNDDEFKDNVPDQDSDDDPNDEGEGAQEAFSELMSVSDEIREHDQAQPPLSSSTPPIFQLLLLHLMHGPILTRAQYRLLTERPLSSVDENAALQTLMQQRQAMTEIKHPVTDRVCVVCYAEPRQCLLKPCRCFAICDECREMMAQRRFKNCPCCRRSVEGWCRIYVP